MLGMLLNNEHMSKLVTPEHKELVTKFLKEDTMTADEVITLAYFAKIVLGTEGDPLEQAMLKTMGKAAQSN